MLPSDFLKMLWQRCYNRATQQGDKCIGHLTLLPRTKGGNMGLKISAPATDTSLHLAEAANGSIDLCAVTPDGKTVKVMNFAGGAKVTRYQSVPASFILPVNRSGRVRVALYR